MQKAKSSQMHLEALLTKRFGEAQREWSISRFATDAFIRNSRRYAPRLDIAVGPFNIKQGDKLTEIKRSFERRVTKKLREFIENENLEMNLNPRCALAIEIVYSGSSKHILGDITNASMMGLYGFVIASPVMINKVKRVFEYVKLVKKLGKAPSRLFNNVSIVSMGIFLKLL